MRYYIPFLRDCETVHQQHRRRRPHLLQHCYFATGQVVIISLKMYHIVCIKQKKKKKTTSQYSNNSSGIPTDTSLYFDRYYVYILNVRLAVIPYPWQHVNRMLISGAHKIKCSIRYSRVHIESQCIRHTDDTTQLSSGHTHYLEFQ